MSSAKTSASVQRLRHVVGEQPRGQPFGHRRLADAGLADKHRIVLAAPAQHFDRALQLVGSADQRIELALPRALGEVRAVGGERVARGRRSFVAAARPAPPLLAGSRRRCGHFRDPVRDVFEDVEPRDALLGEQLRGVGLRLLEDGGENVAGFDLLALRALHVQDRGLQHAAERGGLVRLARFARASSARSTRPDSVSRSRRSCGRSAPQAARIRSPSVSCASAYSRCSSVT